MAKKIFKSLTLSLIVFSVALLAGYLSYALTYRRQADRLAAQLLPPSQAEAASAYLDAPPLQEPAPGREAYYVARFENSGIAIYLAADGKESFLYSLDIYAEDLPAQDLVRLREGVILRTRQELASFEEDYNS